jgi:transposase-like protein
VVELLRGYSNFGQPWLKLQDVLVKVEVERSSTSASVANDVPRQQHHRLTPAERAALVAEYQDGATTAHLARKFEVHKDTVSLAVDQAGVRRVKKRRMNNDDETLAAQLHAQGDSFASIARHIGVAPETVRRRLERLLPLSELTDGSLLHTCQPQSR